jgi:hypothetical protein
MSVSVNPPKTPVTKGSSGIATATIPNICKMPGPPAPFVPVPLPNIGKSGDSPKGYSKKVKIESNAVAIKGSSFNSVGDIASKGTGGGIVSANTHGPTKFVGPGSMDVKIEGKNVQLLSDPMLNNCGPSGSPPNSATLVGVLQATGMVYVPAEEKCPICQKEGHDDLKEDKKTTKPEAKKVAKAYKAKLGTSIQHSTMIAVAKCRDHKKFYADKSGADYDNDFNVFSAFKDAAEGCKTRNEGPKFRKSTLRAVLGQDKRQLIDDAWEKAEEANIKSRGGTGPNANPPGRCAGPRALVLMLSDDPPGIPGALTEQFFNTERTFMEGKITYIDDREGKFPSARAAANGTRPEDRPKKKFRPGETTPPCATCEILLPLLLCTDGKTCH